MPARVHAQAGVLLVQIRDLVMRRQGCRLELAAEAAAVPLVEMRAMPRAERQVSADTAVWAAFRLLWVVEWIVARVAPAELVGQLEQLFWVRAKLQSWM
jgi:hypothetical protein